MKKYNFEWESIHWGLNTHLLGTEGPAEHERHSQLVYAKGQVPGRVSALLLDFVKMMVLNRSYIWGQVTAITGDTVSPQIIPSDGTDMELT